MRARRCVLEKNYAERGMTLLEVLVALGIIALMSLLLYGAFESISRGKKGEAVRAERARQGREAMSRITRELSGAFVSLHNPLIAALAVRRTVFIGEHSSDTDRVDFASFAHRRLERDARESDQCEVGYFVTADPDVEGKKDLVRREQFPVDMEPRTGGVTNVLVDDVESFEIRYLDPISGNWLETWDTTQQTGQFNRLPLEVKVSLVLKGVKDGAPLRFQTKFLIPIRDPLTFGLPR